MKFISSIDCKHECEEEIFLYHKYTVVLNPEQTPRQKSTNIFKKSMTIMKKLKQTEEMRKPARENRETGRKFWAEVCGDVGRIKWGGE